MKFDNTELNLEILGEEAGEIMEVLARIVRMKSKIARFGLTDFHPKNQVRNDHALEEEIGHFWAMVNILTDQKVLSTELIEEHMQKKMGTLSEYYFPMRESNIEYLFCAKCHKQIKGRQWVNASHKSSSICPDCFTDLSSYYDKSVLRFWFGTEGYHFNIKEEK